MRGCVVPPPTPARTVAPEDEELYGGIALGVAASSGPGISIDDGQGCYETGRFQIEELAFYAPNDLRTFSSRPLSAGARRSPSAAAFILSNKGLRLGWNARAHWLAITRVVTNSFAGPDRPARSGAREHAQGSVWALVFAPLLWSGSLLRRGTLVNAH